MYNPAHFAQTQPEHLHQLMRAHPLGVLVTGGAAGLDAEHLPFHFDPTAGPLGTLQAHVARANTLWQRCPTGTEVLVIFRGDEAYVSPNWYPSKHATHRQVPTWNYEVVHAHGKLSVRDDARFVRALLARLTRQHEASQPKPWKMGDAPPDFLNDMVARVVGLEIEITQLVGKSKLSQNKELGDRLSAADALAAGGHEALARGMREV